MKITSIIVLLLLIIGAWQPLEEYRLIAHRGGVVEDAYPENSEPAVEEAINRSYWMVEIDIRETKDGQAVIQHDADFRRFYHDPRRVEDMTLAEIKELKSTPGNFTPLTLEEMAQRCQGKLLVMLDTKAPHSEALLFQTEAVLKKYGLLESAYVIGTQESRRFFLGKAKVGAPYQYLEEALRKKEEVAKHYFLFEHGNELDQNRVTWAQQKGISIVPSVNKFHYSGDSTTMMREAREDIEWLKKSGVTDFQIDSEFDRWF